MSIGNFLPRRSEKEPRKRAKMMVKTWAEMLSHWRNRALVDVDFLQYSSFSALLRFRQISSVKLLFTRQDLYRKKFCSTTEVIMKADMYRNIVGSTEVDLTTCHAHWQAVRPDPSSRCPLASPEALFSLFSLVRLPRLCAAFPVGACKYARILEFVFFLMLAMPSVLRRTEGCALTKLWNSF